MLEERLSGSVTAQNVWGIDFVNDLLNRDTFATGGSVTRIYAQHDANFNITAMIDAGDVTQRYVYTPYGQQTALTGAWATSGASNSIFGFQGGRYDPMTGMLHFGRPGRDYPASIGVPQRTHPALWL